MKLNKKVIDSITVCGLCAMLTVTAVTNSGRSEVKAEDKVLANTGLEHTGYNSYAGVAATLFDYEKGLTAENAVTVEKENVEMVAAAQDAQQEVQPQLTQEQQEWQTKLMPKVEESLNVRAQADEQSDIVGKLYKGSVADIVENDGTWAHIKSGNVDGYVNVSYCVTGTDALSYAYDTCGEIATVNTDGLRVRETADTNSKALEVADQGKTYQVDRAAQAPDGWIAVVSDSQTGYIAADYATRSLNTRVGITIEEEQAQIAAQKEAERKAAEEKAAKEAAKAAKEAQAAGVDGCLVVTPYYNKATQKGLIEHYTAVARSIDLPIIMYNVPSRTGCNIQPETAVKLAREVDNIVAIKAATGNLSQESKTMMLAEGCLDMYSGEDGLIVPLMSIGAKGVISVLSNVAPKQTHDICAEFFAGNIEKSRQLQFEALELVDALFCEVNPIPVKTALNLMGMEVGPLRMPLCEMEEANLNKLKTALKNYGLIK